MILASEESRMTPGDKWKYQVVKNVLANQSHERVLITHVSNQKSLFDVLCVVRKDMPLSVPYSYLESEGVVYNYLF